MKRTDVPVIATQRKLMTTDEAAQYLGVTAADINHLVAEGKLSAYRLGGEFLRFRCDDVQALAQQSDSRRSGTIYRAPPGTQPPWRERIREFLYLHDFYLFAAVLTLLLIAVLLRFA